MKRIVCLLLGALILLSCFISCGNEAPENQDGTPSDGTQASEGATEAVTESTLPAPEITDMNGETLTILNYTPASFSWANTLIFATELTGEVLNDALYQREAKVEELYNCKVEEFATGDVNGTIDNTVMADDNAFDTAMLFDADVSKHLTKGNLLSWNELELDLTTPWWDAPATEQYNFYGIQAAVSGAFSLYNYSTRHCYVFNETMLENIASDTDLYAMVNDGAWTLDAMYELGALAVSDVNGDSVMKPSDDMYGIVSSVTRHYSAILAGAGVKYIDRADSGDLYFTVTGNDKVQTIISKIVGLNNGNEIFTSGTNDIAGGAESSIFYSGRALFIAAYVGEVSRMRDIDFNMGIIPAPKLDNQQQSYYSLVEGGAQSIIPKTLTGEGQKKTAVILDALGYYSYMESIPAYIDIVLMTKVSRNEKSSEMLQLVFDTPFYDLGTGVWSAETKNQFTQNIFLPREDNTASLCAKIEKALNKKLQRFKEDVQALGSAEQ